MGGIGLASAEDTSSWLDSFLNEGIRWKECFLGCDLEALLLSLKFCGQGPSGSVGTKMSTHSKLEGSA